MRIELLTSLTGDVPSAIGGGLWNGPKVKAFLKYKFGIVVSRQTGHSLLKECDYSITSVRPRHKQTPNSEKEKFKKNNLAGKSSAC